jgi:glycosyltransferase involved in cell wall biosynthesis
MKALQESVRAPMRRLWLLRNKQAFEDGGGSPRPRLLVDVSVIARNDAGTGIQRVVRAVWSQLKALAGQRFDIVPVYASSNRGYCYAPEDFLSERRRLGRVPVGVNRGDCFLGLDLAAHALPKWRNQLAAWRANGATVHIVVYDLLPLSRPDWFPTATRQRFTAWLDTLIEHSDQLLCISDQVARALRRVLDERPARRRPGIGRLHLSGDLAGSAPSAGLSPEEERALELARSSCTVLMVGTVEPRKGYDRAIAAFEQLWVSSTKAPSLLIVGRPGWKTAALQERIRRHPELGRRLHWLEQASDEALDQAYTAADAVLIASHAEGFGLPLAEAAMHRRWVLARDLPVFREQALPNTRFFTDDSAGMLVRSIESIVALANEKKPPRADVPSWSRCVEQLIKQVGLAELRPASGGARKAAAS